MSFVALSAVIGRSDRNRGELRDPGVLITHYVGGGGTWGMRDLESGVLTLIDSEGSDVAGELVAVIGLASGNERCMEAARNHLGSTWRSRKAAPSPAQWRHLTDSALDDVDDLSVQVTTADARTVDAVAERLRETTWSWRVSSTAKQSLRTQWDLLARES